MDLALAQAAQAGQMGEVPVGAVLISEGRQVSVGFNCPISTADPTAHAEIVALRAGAQMSGNYRLPETTLYVTLEPCMMCAGALIHARVSRLVYGATETKAGVVHSHPLVDSPWLNHRIDVCGGVRESQCSALLSAFFAARRRG